MTKSSFKSLLACTSTLALCLMINVAHAMAAPAAETPSAPDDQSTTANQAGQANDRQSLTTSDIIVTGSHTAEAAPLTASLTTTQPQAAISREFIDNANAASTLTS
jgi:iron complex outermembrane receptor protein